LDNEWTVRIDNLVPGPTPLRIVLKMVARDGIEPKGIDTTQVIDVTFDQKRQKATCRVGGTKVVQHLIHSRRNPGANVRSNSLPEQALKILMLVAGFTAAEAEEARRAMTHKRSRELMEPFSGARVKECAGTILIRQHKSKSSSASKGF
jgi:hypothetical protein